MRSVCDRAQGGTMRLHVKGKNVEVTDAIQDYAERKLAKLSPQLADLTRVELELAVERNPSIADNHVAEATIWSRSSNGRSSGTGRSDATSTSGTGTAPRLLHPRLHPRRQR